MNTDAIFLNKILVHQFQKCIKISSAVDKEVYLWDVTLDQCTQISRYNIAHKYVQEKNLYNY